MSRWNVSQYIPILGSIKIVDGRLYFILFFLFLFLSFLFLFLEQLGLGLIGHAITSVTRLITRLGELSRRFENK